MRQSHFVIALLLLFHRPHANAADGNPCAVTPIHDLQHFETDAPKSDEWHIFLFCLAPARLLQRLDRAFVRFFADDEPK